MNYYNLYYKSKKLNSKPASEESVKEIMKQNIVRKKLYNGMENIPTKDIRIVKCIIV